MAISGSSGLVYNLIANQVLLLLLLVELGVRKGVHVALRLLAQFVHRAGQELIRWAHCLIRLIAVLLPGE